MLKIKSLLVSFSLFIFLSLFISCTLPTSNSSPTSTSSSTPCDLSILDSYLDKTYISSYGDYWSFSCDTSTTPYTYSYNYSGTSGQVLSCVQDRTISGSTCYMFIVKSSNFPNYIGSYCLDSDLSFYGSSTSSTTVSTAYFPVKITFISTSTTTNAQYVGYFDSDGSLNLSSGSYLVTCFSTYSLAQQYQDASCGSYSCSSTGYSYSY